MRDRPARLLASIDANAIIHFYRAGFEQEPGYVLDGLVDPPSVLREIERRARDIHTRLVTSITDEGSWLSLVTRDDLNNMQKNLYDQSYKVNKLLFDPKDWGEAAAISLGHATGAAVLLTDDTKKSGPQDYILKGAIEAIDTIAFWEVLLLLYAAGRLTPAEFKRDYYDARKKFLYSSYHLGLDLRAAKGTPVLSTAAGTVLLAQSTLVRGNVVYVDHGLGIISAYMHLDRLDVKEGQRVERGTPLGGAGTTGVSTGVHLHWSVYIEGINADGGSLVDLDTRLEAAGKMLAPVQLPTAK